MLKSLEHQITEQQGIALKLALFWCKCKPLRYSCYLILQIPPIFYCNKEMSYIWRSHSNGHMSLCLSYLWVVWPQVKANYISEWKMRYYHQGLLQSLWSFRYWVMKHMTQQTFPQMWCPWIPYCLLTKWSIDLSCRDRYF